MSLLRPQTANINTKQVTLDQQSLQEPITLQPATIQWPTTQVTSNGNGYTNQNKSIGQFQGTVTSLRPIISQKDPTVFAVIDIAVEGKVGRFQDFLHFNQNKAEASMSFLVNRTKAIAQSAGYDVDEDQEHDISWVQAIIEELVKNKAQVKFIQDRVPRGLDIQYI